ncbi:MAG TPA: rod shape-determining protein MreD [Solirubrobacteraceae bacterium]|nr:rod shape-determining protein MreD [Solirubrobacteraceae bacterium]
MSDEAHLGLRLAGLALGAVILQIAVVSQFQIFGVNADITPLVVGAAGLLTGPVAGSIVGFSMGLLIDLLLFQTLGVSALVYTLIGFGAGRLRELRAPQATFTPLGLGAAATAVATIGFSMLEFLLGVDAPISFLLVREILATIILNTLISLPVYAGVRRWLRPALPEDPRRRRRRAYTTGGLSPLSRQ